MHKITVTREINSSVEAVWSVLDDFESVHLYNPAVDSSKVVGNKATGPGAQRVCHFYDGSSLKETITEYSPNKGYSFELSEFALPLKVATSHFRLAPVSADKCRLAITMEFKPKFGPAGWLMAKLMMRPMLKKALAGVAKGLDEYVSTGRRTGKNGVLSPA